MAESERLRAPPGDTDLIPALRNLKNEVAFVNEKIHFPYKLEKGMPCDLSVMIGPYFQKTDVRVRARPYHSRAAGFWRKIEVTDKEGRVYNDADLKGLGLLSEPWDEYVDPDQWYAQHDQFGITKNTRGLLDLRDALHDAKISEELTALGVRTHRVAGVVKLDELPYWKKVRPVEWLKSKGFLKWRQLHPEFIPAISIRLFGTRGRAAELNRRLREAHGASRQKEMVEHAIRLVAQELGKDNMSLNEYMEWFAKTLGDNVGLMHKHGYLHGFMGSQNITLDGRITDFDSVTRFSEVDLADPKKRTKIREHLTRDVEGYGKRATFFRSGTTYISGAAHAIESMIQNLKEIFPDEASDLDQEQLKNRYMQAYFSHNPDYISAN